MSGWASKPLSTIILGLDKLELSHRLTVRGIFKTTQNVLIVDNVPGLVRNSNLTWVVRLNFSTHQLADNEVLSRKIIFELFPNLNLLSHSKIRFKLILDFLENNVLR